MLCHDYIHGHKGKFSERSEEGIFMGYSGNSAGVHIYFPAQNKTKVRRLVVFTKRFLNNDSVVKNVSNNQQVPLMLTTQSIPIVQKL